VSEGLGERGYLAERYVVAVAENMAEYKITFGNTDNVVSVAAAVGLVVKTARRN
jgi:hypothetical protein